MRILQVISSLETGGAEKLVSQIAPMLRNLGNEVDVAVFKGCDTQFKHNLEDEGIKVMKFGKSCYGLRNLIRLTRVMRHYDIVHTHNTAPQLYAAIASVLCSVVLCTTEHNTSNRRRSWKWYVSIDRWMYHQYSRIICISDKAEQNLREYLSANFDNICTIYNGVDVSAFHAALPDAELSHPSKFAVVMVAGFRYQKDQDTVIRAIAMLPDNYELWLVGDGERRKILEKLVEELRVSSSVKFLGLRNDVPNVLHAADVVVMSSHFEGLSLSNIEGMACGKPFVASDVDGLREVTKNYGLLFPHGDAQALSDIIKRLHDDASFYQFIADRCYLRAQQYDISKMVEQYNQVYQDLVLK